MHRPELNVMETGRIQNIGNSSNLFMERKVPLPPLNRHGPHNGIFCLQLHLQAPTPPSQLVGQWAVSAVGQ